MAKKPQLANLLLERALARDLPHAKALILAGEVQVDGVTTTRNIPVPVEAIVSLKSQTMPYQSKGGLKLIGALDAFGINPQGLVCLDAGASTGGFTDCLLKQGASLVYAVDVGFGQLTGALRQDARVVNLERTNLGDDKLLALSPIPSLSTCDLSYLSLTKAVPLYRAIMQNKGTLIALVKPLFETEDAAARRTGELADDSLPGLLRTLADKLAAQPDTRILNLCPSPVTGNKGTREFFFHLVFGDGQGCLVTDKAISQAVATAVSLPHF